MKPPIAGTIVSKREARYFYLCNSCNAPVTFAVPDMAFYVVRCECGKETLVCSKLGRAPPGQPWQAVASWVEPDPGT